MKRRNKYTTRKNPKKPRVRRAIRATAESAKLQRDAGCRKNAVEDKHNEKHPNPLNGVKRYRSGEKIIHYLLRKSRAASFSIFGKKQYSTWQAATLVLRFRSPSVIGCWIEVFPLVGFVDFNLRILYCFGGRILPSLALLVD